MLLLYRNLERNRTARDVIDQVFNVFPRLDVLVVGPGLSRDSLMQDTAGELILEARNRDMAIVVDAVSNVAV